MLVDSARVLLLHRVRESLAGRACVYELWPLTLSEIGAPAGTPPPQPLFDRLITAPEDFRALLAAEPPRLIGTPTVRRYLEYLRLSCQVILLPPDSANLTAATIKTPRIHWMDLGLLRQNAGCSGELTGPPFESLVVSEARKWVDTLGRGTPLSFHRTRSGREVDLVVTTASGPIGIEVKNRGTVVPRDASALRALAKALGQEWVGGLVVDRGEDLRDLGGDVWAVPVHRRFGEQPVAKPA